MKTIRIEDKSEEILDKLNRIEKQLAHAPDTSSLTTDFIPISRKKFKERFEVSYSTMHKWEKDGVLKKYGLVGRVYYNLLQVQAALVELS